MDFSILGGHHETMSWVLWTLAGAGVGTTFGVFGAGGSAFATPVLALLGVPVPVALASPLPAMLPASMAGAHQFLRAGLLDRRVCARGAGRRACGRARRAGVGRRGR